MLMNNRKNDRYQALKAGTISFHGSTIDCAVHDLSLGDANLKVDSHVGVPDTFDLLVADTGKQRCHVVWRKETRIGVVFS
jgi:GDP-D-mannose dehydratase